MTSAIDLSGYSLEVLHVNGEFVVERARHPESGGSFLIRKPEHPHTDEASGQRLEHEFALAGELDPAWAARPLALKRFRGRPAMVLTDPGGVPLDKLLKEPLEIGYFLKVAAGLAAALGQVHARGLVHKDIKPANTFVDTDGHVSLTGFGLAVRLPPESQALIPPQVIRGTWAYMAPEQTGRVNRFIDTRSDLYSLGITFYEMLTG